MTNVPMDLSHPVVSGRADRSSRARVGTLTVRNFRNIAGLDVDLPESGVVIIGDNGQGKTNLIEAVYYLVLFRSLRAAKDRELVRFGTPGFFVAGTAGVRVTAGYEVAGGRKKVTVDGVPVHKLSDAVGRLVAVPFSPADRVIVAGAPSERRRYLDVVLSLSMPGYLEQLSATRAALRQRNAALRQGKAADAGAFDGPLARAAARVTLARQEWVDRWSRRFSTLCVRLGESAEPDMSYRGPGGDHEHATEALARALAASLDRDLRTGTTTVGPHRDDLRIQLGDRDLRTFGSAGQQRTAAIALRLVEAATLATATHDTPVALFDDAFVELDENRQTRLLELIHDALPGQAIVTAPRDSEVPAELFGRPRWRMQGGRIVEA